jgi:hypothetical protein
MSLAAPWPLKLVLETDTRKPSGRGLSDVAFRGDGKAGKQARQPVWSEVRARGIAGQVTLRNWEFNPPEQVKRSNSPMVRSSENVLPLIINGEILVAIG